MTSGMHGDDHGSHEDHPSGAPEDHHDAGQKSGPATLRLAGAREQDRTMITDPGTAVTLLEESACWRLLRSSEVGRLAVSIDDHPDIFPINYLVDDKSIVFRTAEGTKFAAAVIRPSVAFEVDGYEPDVGEAWSVVVKGRAQEISMHELVDTMAFPLFPWHAAPKHRFVRIVPDDISGRHFHVVESAQPGARPR
jgi:uncharacterized protein